MSVATLEKDAALAEGIRPISPEALELHKRYHEIASAMAPFKAEQDAIKELLLAELDATGSKVLTHNGVPVVAVNTVNSKDVNLAGILKAFPGAVQFIGTKVSRRFDAKKPVL